MSTPLIIDCTQYGVQCCIVCPHLYSLANYRTKLAFDLFSAFTRCQVSPIRFATCDLHTQESGSGASFFIETVKLRQYVLAPWPEDVQVPLQGGAPRPLTGQEDVIWLEAAAVHFGPVISDVSTATADPELHLDQKDFLEMHDSKFQRLWFLWYPDPAGPHRRSGCCGCVGGCTFFGKNANGPKFFTADKLDASENDNGVGGFGSDGGFYEQADGSDSSVPPLMYSRDASLDALEAGYMDRSPVGSVEAFTRRRYHVSASESSSPRILRAGMYTKSDDGEFNPTAGNVVSRKLLAALPRIWSMDGYIRLCSFTFHSIHYEIRPYRSLTVFYVLAKHGGGWRHVYVIRKRFPSVRRMI